MTSIASPTLWTAFLAVCCVLLALDLFVLNRAAKVITAKAALRNTLFFVSMGALFAVYLGVAFGGKPALEFVTGYLIEYALSVDNLFVFLVIFTYFAVPAEFQHRVLFWGILGAILLRGLFIVAGAALLTKFAWMIFVFGAFLVYTGIKILAQKETEVHPEKNPVLKLFQRFVPLTTRYHGKHFFIYEGGRWLATPLMLVLVVVEATDVVFAVDSIPAIFAITRNGFIIFTSNIFAILGLRALYFLLAGLMHKFRYLGFGLGLVLAFIGKMLTHRWVHIPTSWSLGVVLGILIVAVVASLLRPMDPGEVVDPTALQEKTEAD